MPKNAVGCLLILLSVLLGCPPAMSDRGMIFVSEVAPRDGKYVAIHSGAETQLMAGKTRWSNITPVRFFEPSQNALIAWNGQEEILYLTTDVRASRASKVLEVLPLPSQPRSLSEKVIDLRMALAGVYDI